MEKEAKQIKLTMNFMLPYAYMYFYIYGLNDGLHSN